MTWDAFRYGRLLPVAARSRRAGGGYAALVAEVELRRDPHRRATATARIGRWLGVAAPDADRLYRRALVSESREEADSAYFMRHTDELARAFRTVGSLPPAAGPVIYVTLHLGSPVLGYLHLQSRVAPELGLVARALDDANPMPAAKRRFATAKVAWTERVAGRPFLHTDAASMLRVRSRLRAGQPIFVLADVPGDAVARSASCRLFGERVRLAAGLATLARIAASPVQTLAVVREPDGGFAVHPGPRVIGVTGDGQPATSSQAAASDLLGAVLGGLEPFIRRFPDQWWMWPYLPAVAVDSAEP